MRVHRDKLPFLQLCVTLNAMFAATQQSTSYVSKPPMTVFNVSFPELARAITRTTSEFSQTSLPFPCTSTVCSQLDTPSLYPMALEYARSSNVWEIFRYFRSRLTSVSGPPKTEPVICHCCTLCSPYRICRQYLHTDCSTLPLSC